MKETDAFDIRDANPQDIEMVMKSYAHNPVPGYEISRVRRVYNHNLAVRFNRHLDKLEYRALKPDLFSPHWTLENNPEKRREIDDFYYAIGSDYVDFNYPNLRVIPTWHGTNSQIAIDSIVKWGYGVRAISNGAFFGQGIYGALEAKCAREVYQQGCIDVPLLFNIVAVYSPYPVIEGDMAKLIGKNNYENYDAHVIPVKPKDSSVQNTVYHPCESLSEHVYNEVVAFDTAAVMPLCIVDLKKVTLAQDNRLNTSSFSMGLFDQNARKKLLTYFQRSESLYILVNNENIAISTDRMGKLYAWDLNKGIRMQVWQAHAGEIEEVFEEKNEETGRSIVMTAGKEDGLLLAWYYDGSRYKEYSNEIELAPMLV